MDASERCAEQLRFKVTCGILRDDDLKHILTEDGVCFIHIMCGDDGG